MGSARAIRAGAAYVELYGDDTRLQRTLKRARRRLRAFGASARLIGASMFAASAGALAPITALSIKAASDAQEIRNKFNQVFRDQADAAGAFADELGDAVGRSGTKLRDSLAAFQAFFVGLGFGAEQSRELSQRMSTLALDFASFNNLSDEEAVGRFISALSGSGEVLDRFGINIKQAALGLELQRQGMADSVQSADELQKAIARVSIITRSMTDQGSVGDAVRTSGQFANQTRRLRDELFEMRAAIGEAVLPLATKFISALNGAIKGVTAFVAKNGELVRSVLKIGGVIAIAGASLFTIGVAATAIASPIFAAVAGVAALAIALEALTGVGRNTASTISEAFSDSRSDIRKTLDAVRADLESGDLSSASKTLAQSIAFEFNQIIRVIEVKIFEVIKAVLDTFSSLPFASGITSVIDVAIDEVQREIEDAEQKFKDLTKRGDEVKKARDAAAAAIDVNIGASAARATGGVSPVGSLSAVSALQRLAGAGQDRLVRSVSKIETTAKRIEQNTREGTVFG